MISRRSLLTLLGLAPAATAIPAAAAAAPFFGYNWLPPAAMAGELLHYEPMRARLIGHLPFLSSLPAGERMVAGPWRRRHLVRERRRRCQGSFG